MGLRLPPSGAQPYALFRILSDPSEGEVRKKRERNESKGYARRIIVGGRRILGVADDDPQDVLIEGMVDHVHVVLGGERARDTIYGTRE